MNIHFITYLLRDPAIEVENRGTPWNAGTADVPFNGEQNDARTKKRKDRECDARNRRGSSGIFKGVCTTPTVALLFTQTSYFSNSEFCRRLRDRGWNCFRFRLWGYGVEIPKSSTDQSPVPAAFYTHAVNLRK
jgi:hypothetical protein